MTFDFNIADFFKLPNKIMAALSLASGMILFLPKAIVEKMYMVDFRNKFGFAIGLVFIVSFSILLITSLVAFLKFFHNIFLMKKFKATAKNRLQNLDIYQKTIIYDLYCEDNHTDELPLHDGAVNFLEHSMMIGKATNQYMVTDLNNACFPYMLQPWVISELQKDNELLITFEEAYKQFKAKAESEMKKKMDEIYGPYSNYRPF
ncbi:MAG: superinfection exclusion B family protein [Clostridiaceae bacterium]